MRQRLMYARTGLAHARHWSAKAKIMRNRVGTSQCWKCIDQLQRFPRTEFALTDKRAAKNVYQYARQAGITIMRVKVDESVWLICRTR